MDIKRLKEQLEKMPDPRRNYGNRRHKLIDIIVIALCSVICGGEGFEDMEEFGENREDWLKGFLELPNGIPSADTFGRVLERLDSKALLQCLHEWLEEAPLYKSGGRLGRVSKSIGSRTYASQIKMQPRWTKARNLRDSLSKREAILRNCFNF